MSLAKSLREFASSVRERWKNAKTDSELEAMLSEQEATIAEYQEQEEYLLQLTHSLQQALVRQEQEVRQANNRVAAVLTVVGGRVTIQKEVLESIFSTELTLDVGQDTQGNTTMSLIIGNVVTGNEDAEESGQ